MAARNVITEKFDASSLTVRSRGQRGNWRGVRRRGTDEHGVAARCRVGERPERKDGTEGRYSDRVPGGDADRGTTTVRTTTPRGKAAPRCEGNVIPRTSRTPSASSDWWRPGRHVLANGANERLRRARWRGCVQQI